MNINKLSAKEMTKQVIGDKMFTKAMEEYGEKNQRNLLVVKEFDGKAEVVCSSKIARKLKQRPDLIKELQKLLVDGDDDENEDNVDDENDYELVSNKAFHLPKLPVPFKDVKNGWNIKVARDYATLYLNLLG